MRYSGREFTGTDLELIKKIIGDYPQASRRKLSEIVCEKLQWHKPDGDLKDMSCRVAMLRMAEDGLITLPASRHRKLPKTRISYSPATDQPITSPTDLEEINELKVKPITNTADSKLWNEYIARYHYLGYKKLCGAQLRYFVRADDQIVAALGFSAAALKLKPRDRWIGWDGDTRQQNLQFVISNTRFLIMPWLKVPNLASLILSQTMKRLPSDWDNSYEYKPVLCETFVDTSRYSGGCYKASNWLHIGETSGRGRQDRDHLNSKPVKSIWLYPFHSKCRHFLRQDQPSSRADCYWLDPADQLM